MVLYVSGYIDRWWFKPENVVANFTAKVFLFTSIFTGLTGNKGY